MFEDKIKEILDANYKEYKNIFDMFGFSSDRFTEENQTVNFCRAVQKICKDALVWYEYPWKKDKKDEDKKGSSCRFDAVVYLPKEESLLIIEAKCLRGSNNKYIAIKNDLDRIIKQNKKQVTLKENCNVKSVYAVILADYWKKGKTAQYYKNVDEVWQNKAKQSNIETEIIGEKDGKPFSEFIDLTKTLENPKWSYWDELLVNRKYCLLSMIGKVK